MKNTGHVLLINNAKFDPQIFLIQEKNKHWGIFGGGQEEHDENSLTNTAVRELHEESLGSLKGYPQLFHFLDHYTLESVENQTEHQTFVVVNSRIKEEHIIVDSPDSPDKGFGDIRTGRYFPLYLILDTIYSGKKSLLFKDEEIKLRYFFAEAIRRNKDFLYNIFQRENINAMEARHRLLNVCPVVSTASESVNLQKSL